MMLSNEAFREARTGRVRIRDCPQKTFKAFVGYLYGQESYCDEDGRAMWELADKVRRILHVHVHSMDWKAC